MSKSSGFNFYLNKNSDRDLRLFYANLNDIYENHIKEKFMLSWKEYIQRKKINKDNFIMIELKRREKNLISSFDLWKNLSQSRINIYGKMKALFSIFKIITKKQIFFDLKIYYYELKNINEKEMFVIDAYNTKFKVKWFKLLKKSVKILHQMNNFKKRSQIFRKKKLQRIFFYVLKKNWSRIYSKLIFWDLALKHYQKTLLKKYFFIFLIIFFFFFFF